MTASRCMHGIAIRTQEARMNWCSKINLVYKVVVRIDMVQEVLTWRVPAKEQSVSLTALRRSPSLAWQVSRTTNDVWNLYASCCSFSFPHLGCSGRWCASLPSPHCLPLSISDLCDKGALCRMRPGCYIMINTPMLDDLATRKEAYVIS